MLDTLNRLDLTAKDIALIEAALHTQKKILSVQSEAGGTGARQKLAELRRVMKRVSRAQPLAPCAPASSWSDAVRGFFTNQGGCSQPR